MPNITKKDGLQYYTSLLKGNFSSALDGKADKEETATALSAKADKAEVDAQLAEKANKGEMDAELAKKATTWYVDNKLASKVNKTEMTASLETKADKAEVDTALDGKADKEDLSTKANADDVTAALATKTTLDEVKAKVQGGEWLPLQEGLGEKSIIVGNQTSATGQYAFASGLSTQASGMYSHAEGVFSIASGNYSHAEGSNAKPKGEYSHAEGERTEIASQGGHAEGVCTYLNTNEDVIHHVGVGYYNDKLSTDVILRKYGDTKNGYQYMIGIGGYNGKDITDSTQSLQEVVADYGQRITSTESSLTTLNDSVAILTSNISDQSTKIDNINDRFASYVPTSAKGTANGIATLDSKGQVPVNQLGNVDTELFLVVTELPTENIKTNKVYLIPSGTTEQGNVYTEWVYVNNAWEKLGEYKPEVDLTAYSTTEQIKTNVQNGAWLPIKQGRNSQGEIVEYAISEGYNTFASGAFGSHAEGYTTQANGVGSHAEGISSIAKGNYAHAEGVHTITTSMAGSHACGFYNYADSKNQFIFMVGDGDDYHNPQNPSRSNAIAVVYCPEDFTIHCGVYIWGIGDYNGQEINGTRSLQQVIFDHDSRIFDHDSRITDHDSRITALTTTRMEVIATGGSASEPVPIWTDSTRHDITQKKRIQTFTGFTNIEVANGVDDTTINRRSWISAIRLSNFHGTKLTRAFYRCGGIKQLDTRSWDTSAVTSMRSTFHGCVQLAELDVSLWDTHSVTDMGYAFCGCSKIKQLDTRSWDTSAVTSMDGLLSDCSGIEELDLSGWDTSHVTTIDSMFNNCGSLCRLYLRYWDLSHVSSAAYLFNGCGAIEELYLGEGFGKVLDAVGTIDFSALTKWTGDSVQTLLYLYNRTAHSSDGYHAITLRLSSQTKAALGTSGIQTLTSRGYTIA